MNCILQEINTHKNNLLILVNNLINTQIITEEIYINNEIRKETEYLNILLNNKQNNIIYNTITFNSFISFSNCIKNLKYFKFFNSLSIHLLYTKKFNI